MTRDKDGQATVAVPLRRAVAGALAVITLGGAASAAWWFTREAPAPGADPHAGHGTTVAGAGEHDTAAMVTVSDDARRRIGVTFARAERAPLERQVRATGVVTFDETRVKAISPKVGGWVEELFVASTGQPVTVGQPLLTIYSPELIAAQEELLVAVRLAAAAAPDTDAARNATALLRAARRRLEYWDIPADTIAHIEHSGVARRTLTLHAPVRGVVVSLDVRAGQRIAAGDAVHVIADLDRVWVEGDLYEQDLRTVGVGQGVSADFVAFPGETRQGRIEFVQPAVSAASRTVRIRVSLANPGQRLKPGMFATLTVAHATPPVLRVPRSALVATGQRTFVFTVDAMGMFVARTVVPGQSTAEYVEIVSGLAEGESVVASATFLIDAESNLNAAMAGMSGMANPGRAK